MSDRPAPLTTTDQMLGLVLDELQGIRADLAVRGGPTTPAGSPPATPVEKKPNGKKKPSQRADRPVDGL